MSFAHVPWTFSFARNIYKYLFNKNLLLLIYFKIKSIFLIKYNILYELSIICNTDSRCYYK